MSLLDLLQEPRPSPPARRYSCPKYEPLPGSRRCRHYLDGGSCARPDEFMCTEFLRANGYGVPAEPVRAGVPSGVPSPVEAGAGSAPAAGSSETGATTRRVELLTDEDIASFRTLGVEVRLASPEWGEFWLVPRYTGDRRVEMTPEDLNKVLLVLRTLGGKVVRIGRPEEDADGTPTAVDHARAHLRGLLEEARP